MGAFESERDYPISLADLKPVAEDVTQHFQEQGYSVNVIKTQNYGYQLSLTKGGSFKAVLGLQSALNITIEPSSKGTYAHAGIGIWGKEALPGMVAAFVAWPVLLTQIWGLVQQSQLDVVALDAIGASLQAHAERLDDQAGAPAYYCTNCGARVTGAATACPKCGARFD